MNVNQYLVFFIVFLQASLIKCSCNDDRYQLTHFSHASSQCEESQSQHHVSVKYEVPSAGYASPPQYMNNQQASLSNLNIQSQSVPQHIPFTYQQHQKQCSDIQQQKQYQQVAIQPMPQQTIAYNLQQNQGQFSNCQQNKQDQVIPIRRMPAPRPSYVYPQNLGACNQQQQQQQQQYQQSLQEKINQLTKKNAPQPRSFYVSQLRQQNSENCASNKMISQSYF